MKEQAAIRQRRIWQWLLVLAIAWTAWASLMPVQAMPAVQVWDKLAHAVNYALLAALLLSAQRRLPPWVVVLAVVAFGGLIELAQAATGYRRGEWLDMLANFVGAVSGTLLWWLVGRVLRKSAA
ncbi:MAG: VanZ family protein [Gammaproteobacteria bacterium]